MCLLIFILFPEIIFLIYYKYAKFPSNVKAVHKDEREEKWTGERGSHFRRQDEAQYGNEDENYTP